MKYGLIISFLFLTCSLKAQKSLNTSIQYGRASTGLHGARFGAGVGVKSKKKYLMLNYSINDLSYDDSYYLKENYLFYDKNFDKFPIQSMKSYNDYIHKTSAGYASLYPRVFTTQIKTIDLTGGLDVYESSKFIFSVGGRLKSSIGR